MEENLYKAMYPTICTSPKFYELPNLHKTGTRSGLLYWAGGSATYGVAKGFAKVLRPLAGKFPHHIQGTKDFDNWVSKVTLLPGECLYALMMSLHWAELYYQFRT